MVHLLKLVAVVLTFAVGLPALQSFDCCCRLATKQSPDDQCCCCKPAGPPQKSCCSSLKSAAQPTDNSDATRSNVTRRCECKKHLSARIFQDTAKRQSHRHQVRFCEAVVGQSDKPTSVALVLNPNSATRAPPGGVRLHVMDCRWLA